MEKFLTMAGKTTLKYWMQLLKVRRELYNFYCHALSTQSTAQDHIPQISPARVQEQTIYDLVNNQQLPAVCSCWCKERSHILETI